MARSRARSQGTRRQPEVDRRLDLVRVLVESYIRGERTNDEIRDEVRKSSELSPLLPECLGVNSLPQELLESLEHSPFDTDLQFERELIITREGMTRNLTLARDGRLEPGEVCDWVTDWFAWHVADQAVDGVVVEIAGDLMLGEEQVEAVVRNEEHFDLFVYHLENTPAAMGDHAGFGLAVQEHRNTLRRLLADTVAGDLSDDAFRADVAKLLGEHREAFPALEDDLAEAAMVLAEHPNPGDAIPAFLRCISRTADPVGCAQDPAYGS